MLTNVELGSLLLMTASHGGAGGDKASLVMIASGQSNAVAELVAMPILKNSRAEVTANSVFMNVSSFNNKVIFC